KYKSNIGFRSRQRLGVSRVFLILSKSKRTKGRKYKSNIGFRSRQRLGVSRVFLIADGNTF
ncbi:MAG: hypothetical protein ACOYVD_05785, partial [Bacillota bacterium]